MRRKSRFHHHLCTSLLATLCTAGSLTQADLYFSEYIEGSSNNKALEIYNNTGTSLDLSAYEVQMYFNGSSSAGLTLQLQGTLADGEVYVVAHSAANPDILAVADQTNGAGWFNGDDAVALLYGGNPIDVIGQIGVDPGTQWGSNDLATANKTLRRKSTVTQGDSNGVDVFDPTLEWEGFAQDLVDDLGYYAASGGGNENPNEISLLINEVDADTAGTDTLEFIELFDGGAGNTSLDGFSLVLFNGSNDLSYHTIDLSGYSTNAEGYLVIGNAAVSSVDIVVASNTIQNGADAVALYKTAASNFPNNTPVILDNLVDAFVYGTSDADDAGLLMLLNAGEPQADENSTGAGDTLSSQRCANGSGGLRNSSSYLQAMPTPGASNQCAPIVVNQCGLPATKIHTIQGTSATSPLVGSNQSIEGVVVGDFQGSDGLNGFFVQEKDSAQDNDPQTAEGIFVFDSGSNVVVNRGDVVRVSGSVSEFFNMTQITAANVEVCATGASVTPSVLTLPVANSAELEVLEGMAIVVQQTLTVTENYNLGRYGELVLSANGRLFNPTHIASPGAAAQAIATENSLRRILLDDGSGRQNPATIIYPTPGLTAFNTVRSGDSVQGLTGVLHYAFDEYRIQPTSTPIFVPENLRTSAPDLPASGSLKIASFNVLNYFNGDGLGGGFPTARGANTLSEFERQRAKIIAALVAMNADVVGLIEIENDGHGSQSAIQDLVNGLHDAGLDYAVVNPGRAQIGTDEISVGFIYKPATIELIGSSAILDTDVDARFIDTKNRPVLAQSFRERATQGAVTVAVAHLKSKGSDCNDLADPDTGDGQGNCNLTRTLAAEAMIDWLASDPTHSGSADILIMGDLNAYAKEDPIATIETAGYVNLLQDMLGNNAYSYVFTGLAGYLDHALASNSLRGKVTGIVDWHINADEPHVLDYNEEYKTPEQVVSLYNHEAYRASDHDPLIIQLDLSTAEPEPETVRGDFDMNQLLTAQDLKLLLRKLGKNVADNNVVFDLNSDGKINIIDTLIWAILFAQSKHH